MTPSLLITLESFLHWLGETSWQASLLVALVLLAQQLAGNRLAPRWHYALWFLVVARLLLPALPSSGFSLYQFAPAWNPPPLFSAAPPGPASIGSSPATVEQASPFPRMTLLALGWLAGVGVMLFLTWRVNRRFARQIAHSPAVTDPNLLSLLAEAQMTLGVHRSIRLVTNDHVQSPAITGLLRPTLLLPSSMHTFDDGDLRLIFLHELAHWKRGDIAMQWILAVLQIMHWFNPVLWLAFRRMRTDCEPATDAFVLSRTGEESKDRYGRMLIKLLENFNQRPLFPAVMGILEDKDQVKNRFTLISRFSERAYGWPLFGLLVLAALAVAGLTRYQASPREIPLTDRVSPQQIRQAFDEAYRAEYPGGFVDYGKDDKRIIEISEFRVNDQKSTYRIYFNISKIENGQKKLIHTEDDVMDRDEFGVWSFSCGGVRVKIMEKQ